MALCPGPLHLKLLAIRCSDVRTIAHASSCAKSFLIRRIRLLEFLPRLWRY
jgi:hypothetical protein